MSLFQTLQQAIVQNTQEVAALKAQVNRIATRDGQIRLDGGTIVGLLPTHGHLGTGQGGVLASGTGFLHRLASSYEHVKSNLGATVDPITTDDSDSDYQVGSLWINITLNKAFRCLDATVGAAVWKDTTAAGGGGGDNIQDADGDTRIETEKNPDEDKIRFTTLNIERMLLDTNLLRLNLGGHSASVDFVDLGVGGLAIIGRLGANIILGSFTLLLQTEDITRIQIGTGDVRMIDVDLDMVANFINYREMTAPATPPTIELRTYVKAFGATNALFYKTGAGVEHRLDGDAGIPLIIDGGGEVITTGEKGHAEVPFDCEIQAVRLFSDVSGSIVVDIWKDTFANFPPVVGDSITASAKPTITSAQKSEDTTLTGWTKTLNKGDILAYNVDSVTSIKRVTVSLIVRKK